MSHACRPGLPDLVVRAVFGSAPDYRRARRSPRWNAYAGYLDRTLPPLAVQLARNRPVSEGNWPDRLTSQVSSAIARLRALPAAVLLAALLAGCGAPDNGVRDVGEYVLTNRPAPEPTPPPGRPAAPVAELLSPFGMAKADALLRRRLPCLGCHRLGEEGGRIGPDLTGLGARVPIAYVKAVIQDPVAMLPGTIMPQVPIPPERVDLIASYLVQREGRAADTVRIRRSPRAPPSLAETRTPAALYAAYCAPCHGRTGRGDGYNAPYLPETPTAHADSAGMSRRPDDTLYDGIHAGARILGGSHRMPPFGESLTRSEIWGLVGYIRQLCRCKGPDWSRNDGRSDR